MGARVWFAAGSLWLWAACSVGLGKIDVGSSRQSTVATADTQCTGTQIGYSVVGRCSTGPTTEHVMKGGGGFFGALVGVHGGSASTSINGKKTSGRVYDSFLEVLGGRGRWALGARGGWMIRKGEDVDLDGDGNSDADTSAGGVTASVHGYMGLTPSISANLGVGLVFGGQGALRLIGGLRISLTKGETATVLVLDVDRLSRSDDVLLRTGRRHRRQLLGGNGDRSGRGERLAAHQDAHP